MTASVTHDIETRSGGPAVDMVKHSWVLAKRSLLNTWRTPESLIDVTISPIMFILLFTYIFGGAIAGSATDYLPFLIPGILGQNIAFAAVGIGIQLKSDMEKGIFDRFRALPISRIAPLFGAALGDVVRYVIMIAVIVGSSYAIGYRVEASFLEFLGGVALSIVFALSLSWAPMLVGLIARSERAVQGIVFMTLFPLTFASNAFVPPETMPAWLEAFANANPLSQLISALRELWTGGDWGEPVLWTLGWCVIFTVVFAPLAIRAYGRRV